MNEPTPHRLVIKISKGSLTFAFTATDGGAMPIIYERYAVKSGISMAANIREAVKAPFLTSTTFSKTLVMVDSPVLLIPIDYYDEMSASDMYAHAYPGVKGAHVFPTVVNNLSAVALSSIAKDLRSVITDKFPSVSFCCSSLPVWHHLHQRSFSSQRNKLFGYFHDKKLEIFGFQQNRFRFFNTFDGVHTQDAVYFLLYVWKQLGMDAEKDELHLAGEIGNREHLLNELHKYLQRAYAINPTGDFNRAPATQIEGMEYDLMTLFVKGR